MGHDMRGKAGQRTTGCHRKTKQGSPLLHAGEEVHDLPLAEQDGLYFRVVAGSKDAIGGKDFDPVVVAGNFRIAFTAVWQRLPPADRRRLLTYWQREADARSLAGHPHDGKHSPMIRVVCESATAEVVLARFGVEMTFPASLVLGGRGRLGWEIARVLAQVHRLATREHWGMVLALIDEPLDCWERRVGSEATEACRERKIEELEHQYLRQYHTRIAQIVQTWGIEVPATVA